MNKFDSKLYRKKIGMRIKGLRDEQGLSLRQLSVLTGMNYGYISDIERGMANATITSYGKLATGLGIDLKDLFDV